jgi:multidrug efflux pump subunit AcrB
MSTGATVAIIVVIVIVIAVAAFGAAAARRRRLRQRFGPEYDRMVAGQQSQRKAQAELASRERRVRKLDIRPLTAPAVADYTAQWASIQECFVDQPASAVNEAQQLVTAVLKDRGYPTEGYDQILADLSVDHARILEHYRAAHSVSESAAAGPASTEDLRQAMIHYRTMFGDLLSDVADAQPSPAEAAAATPDGATAEAAAPRPGRAASVPGGGPDGQTVADGEATAAPAESDPAAAGGRAGDIRRS